VGVWGLNEQSRPTPYVRHSTDCTCCDFGHLRFYYNLFSSSFQYYKKNPKKFMKKLGAESAMKPKFFGGSTPNLSSGVTEAVLTSTSNTASNLRTRHNYKKKETYDKNELIEKRKLLQKEMLQLEMREINPAWQKLRNEVVNYDEIEAKKSARMRDTDDRAREYKQDLEKMMIRVQNQPTLFERQSAVRVFIFLNRKRSAVGLGITLSSFHSFYCAKSCKSCKRDKIIKWTNNIMGNENMTLGP
jgi:hypothetical protein